MKISAVFLDRDGVLNEDRDDYIRSVADLNVYPFVPEAVRLLTDAGIKSYIISNQSGIGRGYFTLDENLKMFNKVMQAAASAGGKISGFTFCPHTPDEGCPCRKPRTGMIRQVVSETGINLDETLMVGDSETDYKTARNAGIPFILVRTGKGSRWDRELRQTDSELMIFGNLLEAVYYILRRLG